MQKFGNTISRVASLVAATLALAACDTVGKIGEGVSKPATAITATGTGGGTTTTTSGTTSIVSTVYTGGTQGRAHGVVVPNTGSISVGGRTPAGGSTATVVRGDDAGAFLDASNELTDIPNAPNLGAASSIGINTYQDGDSLILSDVGTAAGVLTNSHFGLVITDNGTSGSVAAFHAGTLTPTGDLPTGGTASYVGSFNGALLEYGQNSAYPAFGTTSLTADFNTGRMTGSVDNVLYSNGTATQALPYDLAIDANMSGSSYAGTVGYTTALGAPIAGASNSSVSGGFYGPNAGETAGALRIEGTPLGVPSAVVGAFGAIKQ